MAYLFALYLPYSCIGLDKLTMPRPDSPDLIPHQNGDFFSLIVPQVYPQTVPVMVSPLTVRVTFTRSTGAFSVFT
jgi:hypothetical protein